MKKINEDRKEEFKFLYSQKLNDYDIAERMYLSCSTIFRWRKELNLPPNRIKLKSRSREIIPSQEQIEILSGTLLGDSSLQYYPKYRWKSPKFKCDHGEKQKEYAKLLHSKLESLGSSLKYYERVDKRTLKKQVIYCITTKSNPYFLSMYNMLYSTGRKEITLEFLDNFTIRSLAYLYMDDGYTDQKTAYICTDNFSQQSKEILVQYIKEHFNLHFTIVNHGKYYRLRLSQYDFSRFCTLINPYIIDSLKYKLNTVS